jgi:hypothetical protein
MARAMPDPALVLVLVVSAALGIYQLDLGLALGPNEEQAFASLLPFFALAIMRRRDVVVRS